ncbi:MAG: response regulator [Eubacterium sp.]|jgi:signal transduction histidine kinase/ActR/RegA family two-component response regulator|nr:response regulator [Eubacterium sp.]
MHAVFLMIQYLGIVILMLEAFYIAGQKSSRQQQTLLMLVVALCINFMGFLLELDASTMQEALIAVKFSYLGKPYIALCQFLFVMQVCKIQIPRRVVTVLAGWHTLIVFLVFFCDRHTLYYSSIEFTGDRYFPHLETGHGVLYNINSIWMMVYVVLMICFCLSRCRKAKKTAEKRRFGCLVLINLVGAAGYFIYLSGVTRGYDTMLLAYLIDSLLLSVLIFKGGILDTLTLAKELAVDELCEGLVVVDNEENVIYFNHKTEQIYEGITLGKAEAILDDMDDCILEHRNLVRGRNIYAAGSWLIERDNVYYGRMYVLSDITDSYHYTQQVREQAGIMKELKDQAESANRAKSVFVSNMSHEIRTPMNAIVGLTEVLLRRDRDAEDKQYLMNIKSSGEALLDIINDLLDFSKIEAGKFEIVKDAYDVAQMMRDIEVIGKTRIGDKNVTLVMDIDRQIPKLLYGDGLRIRQVILNIMNNAVKYTEEGTVTLSVRQEACDGENVQLQVSVADTGQGIRQEDLDGLFDAFTQVDIKKNQGKEGTGLGLAISRQLVELMGGQLRVESEYGKGSRFYFTLREGVRSTEAIGDYTRTQAQPEQADEDIFTFQAPDAQILLVDDNEINQEVAKALMEPFAMQIDVASNGKQAVEMVLKKQYDIVFMDHFMPVMDGRKATEIIRGMEGEAFQSLPVIALTADAVQGVREELFQAGMNDFVSKPIDVADVSRVLRQWLPGEKVLPHRL